MCSMGFTIKHELFSGGINRTNTENILAWNTANIYKLHSFVFKYALPHRVSPSSNAHIVYMYKSANVDITISLVSNVKLHVFFIFPLVVINETHTYAVSVSSLQKNLYTTSIYQTSNNYSTGKIYVCTYICIFFLCRHIYENS